MITSRNYFKGMLCLAWASRGYQDPPFPGVQAKHSLAKTGHGGDELLVHLRVGCSRPTVAAIYGQWV